MAQAPQGAAPTDEDASFVQVLAPHVSLTVGEVTVDQEGSNVSKEDVKTLKAEAARVGILLKVSKKKED